MSEYELDLSEALADRNFELAKTIITKDNVNTVHIFHVCSVLSYLCMMDETSDLVEMVKWVLDLGADMNSSKKSFHNESPLETVCLQKSYSLCKLLIERGADVNCVGCRGDRPLSRVLLNGAFDIAEMMISRGAVADDYSYVTYPVISGYMDRRKTLQRLTCGWISVATTENIRRIIGKDMIRLVAQAIWAERIAFCKK